MVNKTFISSYYYVAGHYKLITEKTFFSTRQFMVILFGPSAWPLVICDILTKSLLYSYLLFDLLLFFISFRLGNFQPYAMKTTSVILGKWGDIQFTHRRCITEVIFVNGWYFDSFFLHPLPKRADTYLSLSAKAGTTYNEPSFWAISSMW